MDFNKLKKELATQANSKDICKEWLDRINSATSKNDLLQMYVDGIDFCLSTNYPGHSILDTHFKNEMKDFGMFLNQRKNLVNDRKVICHGNSELRFKADNYAVSQLFLKDKTKAVVTVRDRAFVMIDVFDEVDLSIQANDYSKVCVNLYKGAKVTFKQDDNSYVKVIYKNTKTYE